MNSWDFGTILKYGGLNLQRPWGWKDPRTSLLLGFWLEAYPQAQILHVYRHPLDVANSLATRETKMKLNYHRTKRDSLRELLRLRVDYQTSPKLESIEEGVKLWTIYEEEILKNVANLPAERVLQFGYEDFLLEPEKHMGEICDFTRVQKDMQLIGKFVSRIDRTRRFAFRSIPELAIQESMIEGNSVAKALGYVA